MNEPKPSESRPCAHGYLHCASCLKAIRNGLNCNPFSTLFAPRVEIPHQRMAVYQLRVSELRIREALDARTCTVALVPQGDHGTIHPWLHLGTRIARLARQQTAHIEKELYEAFQASGVKYPGPGVIYYRWLDAD